jgi:hypothetical protein
MSLSTLKSNLAYFSHRIVVVLGTLQHSMVYFFHHYELPLILQQAQLQHILLRNAGNLGGAEAPHPAPRAPEPETEEEEDEEETEDIEEPSNTEDSISGVSVLEDSAQGSASRTDDE